MSENLTRATQGEPQGRSAEGHTGDTAASGGAVITDTHQCPRACSTHRGGAQSSHCFRRGCLRLGEESLFLAKLTETTNQGSGWLASPPSGPRAQHPGGGQRASHAHPLSPRKPGNWPENPGLKAKRIAVAKATATRPRDSQGRGRRTPGGHDMLPCMARPLRHTRDLGGRRFQSRGLWAGGRRAGRGGRRRRNPAGQE